VFLLVPHPRAVNVLQDLKPNQQLAFGLPGTGTTPHRF